MTLEISFAPQHEKIIKEYLHSLLVNVVKQLEHEQKLNNKYVNKKSLCKYLGLSNNTVDKLIASGLPQINVDGVAFYDKTQVDQWLTNYKNN